MTTTAQAIKDTLSSPNVSDANMEPANVVDVVADLAKAARAVAAAIVPPGVICGDHYLSLTEEVGSVGRGLHEIAEAINKLAIAVTNHQ